MKKIGFRGANIRFMTAAQVATAKRVADEAHAEYGEELYRAELRPASYLGPGSAGDRGAAVVALSFRTRGVRLVVIEKEVLASA